MYKEIKNFLGLTKNLNLTQTATTLNLSDNGLRRQTSKLEEFFGCQLLQKVEGKKLPELTLAGKYLATHGYKILDSLDTFKSLLHYAAKPVTGVFNLGVTSSVEELYLPNLLEKFCSVHPNLRINLTSDFPRSLYADLDENLLDCIIVASKTNPQFPSMLGFCTDKLKVIRPYNWFLYLQHLKDPECPWVVNGKSEEFQYWLDYTTNYLQVKPKKVLYFNSSQAVLNAVKHNLGCALISTEIAGPAVSRREISYIKSTNSPTRRITCVRKRITPITKAWFEFLHNESN